MGVTFKQSHGLLAETHQASFIFSLNWRRCARKRWPHGLTSSCSLQGYVAEEVGHGLAIVGSPDGLRQDHGDVDDLQEITSL